MIERNGSDSRVTIIVLDAATRGAIAGAIVTMPSTTQRTDKKGLVQIEATVKQVGVRAYGYAPIKIELPAPKADQLEILLQPISPRAVYVNSVASNDRVLRKELLELRSSTQVNALVVDVKDDRGALWLGGGSLPVMSGDVNLIEGADLQALVNELHRHGMYAIARIVVFKDDYLARSRPDMALTGRDGLMVHDNDGTAWTDPQNRAVWAYNIAVAVTAAQKGFDEIQFDYIRFPSLAADRLHRIVGSEARREAIRGFLSEARASLLPYNVFVSADVFGYASWDGDDTNIGQNIEDIAGAVDYICLMLYPSSFRHGLPGSRMPLDNPRSIVDLSLRRAQRRTGLPPIRFRPWLQAFRDYQFDRRPFGRAEITAQTEAVDQFGADGWMLWNAKSVYSAQALP